MMKPKAFVSLLIASSLYPALPAAGDVVQMSLEQLLLLDGKDVPERVRVTGLLDPYGRINLDGHARILEKLPADWEHTGKISMSDRYSRAGEKSVRWDWNGGDIIRIRGLGVLSTLRYRNSRSHNSARYLPLEISFFIEDDLPDNTEFLNMYLKRVDREGRMKLVKFRYYMTYGGTWVVVGQGGLDSGLGEIITQMPEGLKEPEPHELVIQVPDHLKSGTYYLDRILTVAQLPYEEMLNNGKYLPHSFSSAYNMIDEKAVPIRSGPATLHNHSFIPDAPIDPTSLSIHSEDYLGYFAEKPPIPEKLTPDQEAYVKNERRKLFGELEQPLPVDSEQYQAHLEKVKIALDTYCSKQADRSYRFKESLNFSGPRVWFKGDTFHHRKHLQHIPDAYRDQGVSAPRILRECCELFIKSPDAEEAQQLFRASVAWFKYQVTNPPAYIYFSGKYGVDPFRNYFNRLIPLLNSKGDAFEQEAEYLSSIFMFAGKAYSAAWHKKLNSANSLELGHALNIYQSLLYESDDRILYAMLKNFRDNWKTYYRISIWGRQGMIKPDYTFFHHSELSYWGNITGYTRIGEAYANSILDFEPETHRTIANHISRYVFGTLRLETIKGGQEHNWGKFMRVKGPAEKSRYKHELDWVTAAPKDYLFDYLYGLDWEKVPAAKKYVSGVLGNATCMSGDIQDKITEKYPKTKGLKPQTDMHLSANWTGASTYTYGQSTVYALGAKEITQWRGGTPLRRYGSLLVAPRFGSRPLGATQYGYSWVRVPGNTMPALTDEEWQGMVTDKTTGGNSIFKFGVTPIPGNGSLSFNETDHAFGTCGNFALKINEPENSSWTAYGVKNLQGHKSYHFFKDRVVCLGSDYQAETDRSMRTILLQEMVGDVPWSHRDQHRWDTGAPQIVINGKTYKKDFATSLSMEQSNYIISPYGHAWLIGGKQKGRLRVSWKERETLYNYRFNKSGHIQPGQEMTKGTGVIASLEQNPKEPSSHAYCVLLNTDGKSPQELESYVVQTMREPGYKVLKQNHVAHAVAFQDGDTVLASYLVFTPNSELNLPLIKSTSKRVNLMFKNNQTGQVVVSVCDPEIAFSKDHNYPADYPGMTEKESVSRLREVQIVFNKKITLISSHSGLPEANPPLDAKVIGAGENILSYKTSNAVTDTFVLSFNTRR